MPEWISVKDRFPEKDQRVAVLADEGAAEAYWDNGHWYFGSLGVIWLGPPRGGTGPIVSYWSSIPDDPVTNKPYVGKCEHGKPMELPCLKCKQRME